MDALSVTILIIVSAATAAMVLYVWLYLPEQTELKYLDSLQAFGTAIQLRFPSHQGLTDRVVSLSLDLGRAMGLHHGRLRDLEMAALLRDIGLCAIPYGLVNSKPYSSWDESDYLTYMRHPEVGGAMLELIPSLRHLALIVRCHHAAFDGSDGPFFPRGSGIPIEARILCVAAEYVWQERLVGELLAREWIREGRKKRLDPAVVDHLILMLTSQSVDESREPATVF